MVEINVFNLSSDRLAERMGAAGFLVLQNLIEVLAEKGLLVKAERAAIIDSIAEDFANADADADSLSSPQERAEILSAVKFLMGVEPEDAS